MAPPAAVLARLDQQVIDRALTLGLALSAFDEVMDHLPCRRLVFVPAVLALRERSNGAGVAVQREQLPDQWRIGR